MAWMWGQGQRECLQKIKMQMPFTDHKSSDSAPILSCSRPLAILPEQVSKETVADPVLKQVGEILQTRWPEKKEMPKNFYHTFMFRVNVICGVINAK